MIPVGVPLTPIDNTERRRALAKVYALLLRLADNEKQTVDSGNLGGETLPTAERKDPSIGQESIHE
jgi:hypothetical protein